MVIPEDLQAIGPAVMAHRLEHAVEGVSGREVAVDVGCVKRRWCEGKSEDWSPENSHQTSPHFLASGLIF